MKIRLHAKQGVVFQDTSRFKVVAAGRRFGKTVLACVILFLNAVKNRDGIYWLVAPTYGQAKELAWNILIKMIPREMLQKKPNETNLIFTFKNGAEIHLKGADNPDTLKGRGLRGIIIDEVATIRNSQRVWEEILRPCLSDYQGFCLFIGTPRGKDYFWRLWTKGQLEEEGYKSWRFKTEDNPHIPRSEIKEVREQVSERYFRQEYEASFEDFSGLIYPEFNHKKHIIQPKEIPLWWETCGAIDTALSGTTAALYGAVDDQGKLYITGEYYEQDKRVSEVCGTLRKKVCKWVIDPSSKQKTQNRFGTLYSLQDEYTEHGVYASPAQNDVDGGISRVAEYLKSGRLRIFNTCKNLIEELELYHWTEVKETSGGVLKPKPYKSRDHACFGYNTLVMMGDGSSKKIGEIKAGEIVMTPAGPEAVINSGITRLTDSLISVTIGNQLMEVTDDHEFACFEQEATRFYGKKILPLRELFFETARGRGERVSPQNDLGVSQREDLLRLSHSSQGWEQGEQRFEQLRVSNRRDSSLATHDAREAEEGIYSLRQDSASYKKMARFFGGSGVALKTCERDSQESSVQTIPMHCLRTTIQESNNSEQATSFLRVELQNDQLPQNSPELSATILQEKPQVISRLEKTSYCIATPCGWFVLSGGLVAKNCDALRYLVMSRPFEGKRPKPRSKDKAIPMAGELILSAESTWDKWNES